MTSVYDLIGVTLRGAAGGSRWMATERVLCGRVTASPHRNNKAHRTEAL